MKMFAMLLPALMVGSLALAQGGGDAMAAAPKTKKEAYKACKDSSAGDKKAMKKCMKDWKKSQGK